MLIVDDSNLIVERIRLLLNEAQIDGEIESASTYSEALLKLAKKQPRVAILDIHLPDGSGIDLLTYIKKNHAATRVIMASNQQSVNYYKDTCLKAGADYFIDKSKEFESIPELVATLISKKA